MQELLNEYKRIDAEFKDKKQLAKLRRVLVSIRKEASHLSKSLVPVQLTRQETVSVPVPAHVSVPVPAPVQELKIDVSSTTEVKEVKLKKKKVKRAKVSK